jgi:hypothetical protein
MENSNNLNSRIFWVCNDCGNEALSLSVNKNKRKCQVSTYHVGECDVCGKDKPVTQTRDFGFPVFEKGK